MQGEALSVPIRLSTTRWIAYGSGVVLALVALLPFHHHLWPMSVLLVGGAPVVDHFAVNRDRPQAGRPDRGEEPITSRLAELEGNGYMILRHVQAGRNRIDQVIVGPTGIFVIRVNTWSGRFSIRRDGWFLHTRGDAGELVWDVAQEVMAVKAQLQANGLVGRVQGLVAVTRSSMEEPVIHMGRVTFVDSHRLIDYVTSRRPSLSADEVSEAAAGLPA
jgi:Nuclease-related domain